MPFFVSIVNNVPAGSRIVHLFVSAQLCLTGSTAMLIFPLLKMTQAIYSIGHNRAHDMPVSQNFR